MPLQALSRLIIAAASLAAGQDADGAAAAAEEAAGQSGIVNLAQRTLYNLLKRTLASTSLSVRQVRSLLSSPCCAAGQFCDSLLMLQT